MFVIETAFCMILLMLVTLCALSSVNPQKKKGRIARRIAR